MKQLAFQEKGLKLTDDAATWQNYWDNKMSLKCRELYTNKYETWEKTLRNQMKKKELEAELRNDPTLRYKTHENLVLQALTASGLPSETI